MLLLFADHAADVTDDEGSPPPGSHSITRALRFDPDSDPDSPTALLVRTPVVSTRRLKSVVVVPSPEEGAPSGPAEVRKQTKWILSTDLIAPPTIECGVPV